MVVPEMEVPQLLAGYVEVYNPETGRTLRSLGHEPPIIPAMYVKPFVKGDAVNAVLAAAGYNFRRIAL